MEKTATYINVLGNYCGVRDIPELTKQNLRNQYGFEQADLLILFGGSIPAGCDIAAQAFLNGVTKQLMIVGGAGHTTDCLRQTVRDKYPSIHTEDITEAEIMASYLSMYYGISNVLLEKESTNCGNNITYALKTIQVHNINPKNIIIIQDATMQRRMYAGFQKYAPDLNMINFAAYQNKVVVKNNNFEFEDSKLWGMWDINHYITLLLGEIKRLTNDKNGYGPNGQNYIAEVDIPIHVQEAFEFLSQKYSDKIRVANPLFK
jgi:hypothetical protein